MVRKKSKALGKMKKSPKKTTSKKSTSKKSEGSRAVGKIKKAPTKNDIKKFPTLKLKREHDIAMDFAIKAYKKFDRIVKSIVLFGSSVKQNMTAGSDIDIILVIDDASIKWDTELITWYRHELDDLLKKNPYNTELHINTIKITTWWEDLIRGDPTIMNVLRYGEAMIDYAGFFNPLKQLLIEGKIKSTPEAIYSCLQRAPIHIGRSKSAELSAIEGLHWAMVDSAQAALIAANITPPSPEHIPSDLNQVFVNSGKLKSKYVSWYRDLLMLHKKIVHGEISDLKGVVIDDWQEKTEEFLGVMAKLVNELVN